jgi:hypothetical protein
VHREAEQRGVVLVGVSIDDDARAAERVKRDWSIPYPVALDDGSVKRNYGVSLVPTFVLGRAFAAHPFALAQRAVAKNGYFELAGAASDLFGSDLLGSGLLGSGLLGSSAPGMPG